MKKFTDIILDLFDSYLEPDRPGTTHTAPPPKPATAAPAPRPAPAAAPVRDPAARDEAAVLAIVRRAGGEYRRVVFTRNRRIMASVGKDRSVLRLNEAFATAPEEVLFAVGVLFSPGKGRRKRSANETVRAFINALPPVPAAPRPRRRTLHPADRPLIERLQAEFDRVNRLSFGGRLPRVPIHLSRQMRRRNGHFSSQPLEIVISHRLCVRAQPGEAEHTLRHEMIHLWQYMEGVPVDHGTPFRRMAQKLDVHPRATRPVRWKGR